MCLDERTYVVQIGQEEPDESRTVRPWEEGEEDGLGSFRIIADQDFCPGYEICLHT